MLSVTDRINRVGYTTSKLQGLGDEAIRIYMKASTDMVVFTLGVVEEAMPNVTEAFDLWKQRKQLLCFWLPSNLAWRMRRQMLFKDFFFQSFLRSDQLH